MCEGISQAAVAIDALQGLHTLLASRTPPAQLATFDISHPGTVTGGREGVCMMVQDKLFR